MKLIFPYTFVAASGWLPAPFSYTGIMIQTVDSYFSGTLQLWDEKESHLTPVFHSRIDRVASTIVVLPAIPNPE